MPEQGAGLILLQGRHIQRRNAKDELTIDAQDFAARRQDRHVLAETYGGLREFGRGVDDMFAIVENQDQFFSPMVWATISGEMSETPSLRPSALATAEGRRSGFDSEANSTSHTSPKRAASRLRATSTASLVFPIPPGPVSVTVR